MNIQQQWKDRMRAEDRKRVAEIREKRKGYPSKTVETPYFLIPNSYSSGGGVNAVFHHREYLVKDPETDKTIYHALSQKAARDFVMEGLGIKRHGDNYVSETGEPTNYKLKWAGKTQEALNKVLWARIEAKKKGRIEAAQDGREGKEQAEYTSADLDTGTRSTVMAARLLSKSKEGKASRGRRGNAAFWTPQVRHWLTPRHNGAERIKEK